jgi:iron-sulfur cluster assembly accessory protein
MLARTLWKTLGTTSRSAQLACPACHYSRPSPYLSRALSSSSWRASPAVEQQAPPPLPPIGVEAVSSSPAKPRTRSFKARKAAIELVSSRPTPSSPVPPLTLSPCAPPLHLQSPTAVVRIKDLLDSPTPQLIRIGVRNKGCAGMSYHLEYVAKPERFDEVVEQDGVKVVVDSKALFSIIGSEMDWQEDALGAKFVFKSASLPSLRAYTRLTRVAVVLRPEYQGRVWMWRVSPVSRVKRWIPR